MRRRLSLNAVQTLSRIVCVDNNITKYITSYYSANVKDTLTQAYCQRAILVRGVLQITVDGIVQRNY